MSEPFTLSVRIERYAVTSRWATHAWRVGAVESAGAGDPGFAVALFRDEAEGYYLNVSSGDPRAFVMLRLADDDAESPPAVHALTLSYNEAARWMDAQERVDAVPLPAPVRAHLESWVAANYRPEPKKKRLKASFVAPGDKARL
jgi:hypothetical protein